MIAESTRIRQLKLERLCKLITDGTHSSPKAFSSGDFLYLTSKNVRPGRLDLRNVSYVAESDHKIIFRACPVQFGDVLLVKDGANAGSAAVNTLYDPFSLLSSVAVLRPNPEILDAGYLVHWLNTDGAYKLMTQRMSGSAIRRLILREISSLSIPVPPLEEQKRIAAILDKADAIRRKREQAIKLADEFLRCLFLDMFGDPVRNPKGWPIASLLSLSLIRSGVTKGRTLRGEVVEVPYVRVANVQDGHLNLSEVKTIPATEEEIQRYSLLPGDVLLTEGGDPDKLGRGAVWRGEVPQCIHQNHVFCVRPDRKEILPDYLSALLGSALGKRYFLAAAKQTTGIASINKTQLSEFPVLVPPHQLQVLYCKAVSDLKAIKECQLELLGEATNLFASLTHRAFRGEI